MKYTNEKLGCSFELPDRPTVRQQLKLFSDLRIWIEDPPLIRYWEAGKQFVTDWQCEVVPDLQAANLDEMTNPKQTNVISWVGLTIHLHFDRLEDLPPNS
jgi:hypothetical protein